MSLLLDRVPTGVEETALADGQGRALIVFTGPGGVLHSCASRPTIGSAAVLRRALERRLTVGQILALPGSLG